MLSIKRTKPKDTDLFRIPFSGSVSWVELIEMYPDILTEIDGECRENCLLFYYERNPVSQIYEFKDDDTELDFADILKIDMNITKDGESKQEKEDRKSKSCNDLNDMFREFIKEEPIIPVHNSLDSLTDFYKEKKLETKRAKKERRLQKLLERKEKEEKV